MITIIFGKIGAGKTSLMAAMAVDRMTGTKAFEDIQKAKEKVKMFNAGGMNLSPPQKHVVYANFAIESEGVGYPKRRSYWVDPGALCLANDETSAAFVAPCSTICITESQRYYDSRNIKGLKPWFSRYYEASRQWGLNLILDVQRLKLVDLNIRDLSGQIIYVTGQRHRYDWRGQIIKTNWRGRLYDDAAKALLALDAGRIEKDGSAFDWFYEGNIYRCYDSFAMQSVFLDGHYDRTEFDREESRRFTGGDINQIKEFNARYSFLKEEKGDSII